MSFSVLDRHMDDYLKHDARAREALAEGNFDLARAELYKADEAASEILSEAATIEDDLEYLEADINFAEEEAVTDGLL